MLPAGVPNPIAAALENLKQEGTNETSKEAEEEARDTSATRSQTTE